MPTRARRHMDPMVPAQTFCPDAECFLRGTTGAGNITIHSRAHQRYRCSACGHTFAATRGTPFFRLRSEAELVVWVVTLLAGGCPPQAIVAAFGLDERTVADWQRRAGDHCTAVHRATVAQGQVEVEHVQADELWVKMVGRKLWMARALAVPTRLWLGGVLSHRRDGDLIRTLVEQVRRCARSGALLVCVDGFSSYVPAFCRAFKEWLRPASPPGRGGLRKCLPAGFLLGQVIKSRAVGPTVGRVVGVARRAVVGTVAEITQRLQETGSGHVINTAYIERLNATFRGWLAPLTRRGRCPARQEATLQAGMYLVGTLYNFCTDHASLRRPLPSTAGRRWQERTPAMAAGLTDHRWTVQELLSFRVVPSRWAPPKQRGRYARAPRRYYWKVRPKRYLEWPTTV